MDGEVILSERGSNWTIFLINHYMSVASQVRLGNHIVAKVLKVDHVLALGVRGQVVLK
jgi:hypothetical protein